MPLLARCPAVLYVLHPPGYIVQLESSMYGAFRMIIPRLRHRIPLTWYNAPYPIACYIPFLYLAYLARRPGTYRLRLSLLPVVICALVTAASRFVWVGPSLNTFNWGQCEPGRLDTHSVSKPFSLKVHLPQRPLPSP